MRSPALGQARQLRRAFAHLRHRARRGSQLVGIHGLDRIDHHDVRRLPAATRPDLLQLDFRQQTHLRAVQPEPVRAQRHLRADFLAGDVQHAHAVESCRPGLQQQRGLADARVAADQHDAAADQAAAQHAVQLVDAGGRARHLGGVDLAERGHRLRAGQGLEAVRRHGASARASCSVFQAPQCGHLPSHLGLAAAAVAAGVVGLVLGHGGDCRRRPAMPSRRATPSRPWSASDLELPTLRLALRAGAACSVGWGFVARRAWAAGRRRCTMSVSRRSASAWFISWLGCAGDLMTITPSW